MVTSAIFRCLLNQTQTILDSGNSRLLQYEIETSSDWKMVVMFSDQPKYDYLIMAFEELLDMFGKA